MISNRFTQRLKQISGRSEEIGFGTKATGQTERQLNKDGSFNVICKGLPIHQRFVFFHYLVTASRLQFILIILFSFLVVNSFFTLLYVLAGKDSLNGLEVYDGLMYYIEVFSLSAQSLTTLGYGRINPHGIFPNLVSNFESLLGLLSFALATGLLYGRFSRPRARFIFSNCMVVAPFRDTTGLMFRVANRLNHQVTELQAQVNFSILQDVNGNEVRKFYGLPLELNKVNFFPTSWTINHIIDEKSPLNGLTSEDLIGGKAEFLILMHGFDENFSQTVYIRYSYTYDEIRWGHKFTTMLGNPENGKAVLHLDRISSTEAVVDLQ